MSKRNPTSEQRAAILADGEILVSASAGSGKTYVMVEKLIALILDEKADVSSVLAVTFTKLAAAEMKERLRAALVDRINEEKDAEKRTRLKNQLAEVSASDISTVHSFCTNVIRRYFYETDVAGNFRVADEEESQKMLERAVSLTFDSLLEAKDPQFLRLCRIYAGSKGFSKLKDTLLKAYKKLVARADYIGFLQGLPQKYTEQSFDAVAEEVFAPVRASAKRLAEVCTELSELIRPYAEQDMISSKQEDFFRERITLGNSLAEAKDLFEGAEILLRYGKLTAKPKWKGFSKGEKPEEIEQLDRRMSKIKDRVDSIKESFDGLRPREEELAAFLDSEKTSSALCALLIAFDGQYNQLKRRAGVLDFSDLEQKCLQLLEIDRVRAEVASRYTHIFVDEYQDVNPVQERILSLIAGENVFMVGDAKQSIYGFRGCNASFFTEKYERLKKQGRALTLNGNFRSCSKILDTVNDLFSQAMTQETCSIDYTATSMMKPGTKEQIGGEVCIEFVSDESDEEEEEEKKERDVYSVAGRMDAEQGEYFAEAALIADLVCEEASRTRHDPVLGEVRNGYGDIVVLTRSKQGQMQRIVRELVRRGIPVAASAEVNICDYSEVKTAIALLEYLDNGEQDIPLAAALKSPLGGLTDAELARIRLASREKESFCAACERYAQGKDETAQKIRAFYEKTDRLRLEAGVRGAAEMLNRIFDVSGMELALLSTSCGAEKVRRLQRLVSACADLTIPQFLEKLKNSEKGIGFAESGGENAVRVMTMHASKGLEFPVVIVAGMNAPFSNEDMKGILFDDEWGFAAHAYDLEGYVSSATLLRTAVKRRLVRKRAEDEMRILYVALTRAKSTLHLIFSKEKDYDDEGTKSAGSFADFIDVNRFAHLRRNVYGSELEPPQTRVLTAQPADEELCRAISSHYRPAYPYADSLALPVKTSASALLRSRTPVREAYKDADQEDERLQGEFYASKTDAQTGTAYHAFLERADFSAPPREEAARVCALLAQEGFAGVEEEKGAQILSLPLFARLKGYDLFRERAFLLTLPANRLYETTSEDEVLVQGVVDLMAVKGEECVVVDYKYSSHGAERLLQDYTPQLKIYAAAAAKQAGIKKVSAYILNIALGFFVEVPLS